MVLNYIWVAFFIIAFGIALVRLLVMGDTEVFPAMMSATFDSSKTAFEISLGLTGVLSLWLGIMKIGEKGGVIAVVAKVLSPVFAKLFPDISNGHPVTGSIFMNIAANMLGLDNAATPLGLKAMEQLQQLNPKKDSASNPMIMFLVLNTSGLTLIPVSIMVYRAQMGAAQPTDIFIPILLATFFSTLAGIIITSLYQRISLLSRVMMLTLGGMLAVVALIIWGFGQLDKDQMNVVSTSVANILLMTIIVGFIVAGLRKRINVYDTFVEGAKDGFATAVRIIPYLVAICLRSLLRRRHRFCGSSAHGVDEAPLGVGCPWHDGRCHEHVWSRLVCGPVELYFPGVHRHHLLYLGRLLRQCGHPPHPSCRQLWPLGRSGRCHSGHLHSLPILLKVRIYGKFKVFSQGYGHLRNQ